MDKTVKPRLAVVIGASIMIAIDQAEEKKMFGCAEWGLFRLVSSLRLKLSISGWGEEMRKFWSLLTASAVAVLLMAVAVAPSDAAPNQHHSADGRSGLFDGVLSVVINTSSGSCSSYRISIRIVGGRVEGGDGDYSLDGSVRGNGETSVTVRNRLGEASGYGRLHGSSGGGWWRTSGDECAGSWGASRRG